MRLGNILRSPSSSPQRSPPQGKCRIKVKKHSDGSYTKEISGTCSKDELRALSDIDGRMDNIVVD